MNVLFDEGLKLEQEWAHNARWQGCVRPYSAADVLRLRGSIKVEHSLALHGAVKLWELLQQKDDYVHALGALTGNQAVQMAKAGLKAIYVSGWQVAADANSAHETYPDQSLYPVDSVPRAVMRMNNALRRADQINNVDAKNLTDWQLPIIADAEAGFGGVLNAFELMGHLIAAGAAGVHFEDQLASAKKCGHLGGKVLVSTREAIQKLVAARLAADIIGVPTILIARTDAYFAFLLTTDIDERDQHFLTGKRTNEGYFSVTGGIECAIARGLAFAPYADVLWCETSQPSIKDAQRFAEAIHAHYPGKLLAYNCSPSFNWKAHLTTAEISEFQQTLGTMGYKFQFVTLAGFHALNHSMFELAHNYRHRGMAAYVELQEKEFLASAQGYTAVKHQREVGTSYFDAVLEVISQGDSCIKSMEGSTENAQFTPERIKSDADG